MVNEDLEKNIDEKIKNSKPYTRWWWFSGDIRKEDIDSQLEWLKENNFGGVEISWVYPNQTYRTDGPRWLSNQWVYLVNYAKDSATKLKLGCDFTFGTIWPFGGSFVDEEDALKTFNGLSTQRLTGSWEMPHSEPGFIIDHLSRDALRRYSKKMGNALENAIKISPTSLFCDSWEIETNDLWTPGLDERFLDRFGYDLEPFKSRLDNNPDVRYDYRKLVAEYIQEEFYNEFGKICNELGALSRVQAHGSPTDLLRSYTYADIPESEAILFDPPFSRFAASSAAISGKKIVSCESFTCLYGWPKKFSKKEQIADIKLLADSLFANGVNQIIWHGMPYNLPGFNNEFLATIHVGRDSPFADQLKDFNLYLEKVSRYMREGKTHSDIAVYLPLEDSWMKGEYDEELRRPGGVDHLDLRHLKMPDEVLGFSPIWISGNFLKDAEYSHGKLKLNNSEFSSLYVDAEYLDIESLKQIVRLAKVGLPVCLKRRPKQPGHIKEESYASKLEALFSCQNCGTDFAKTAKYPPLIEGKEIPEYWCRNSNEEMVLFFANPKSKEVKYPMRYGQSFSNETLSLELKINAYGRNIMINPRFEPYQSLLYRIKSNGKVIEENIRFVPKKPARI